MIINSLIAYGVYLLGASLYLLNVMEKYKKIAEANPNEHIVFVPKEFWRKESLNIVRILLIGIATPVLLIPLSGMQTAFINAEGVEMFKISVKTILIPLYLIIGWGGGNATIALAGKYKEGLYKSVGITEKNEV